MSTAKRITLATIKSFIKKNADNLQINVTSKFDGMIDGARSCKDGFKPAVKTDRNIDQTCGIQDVWFVGSGRNCFEAYEDDARVGYRIDNSCRTFIIAIAK